MIYDKLILNKRFRPSKVAKKENITEDTESDRARLIFSNSFRRLDKKAQVFPLDDNSAVRNRLTHSIEVSHIGRTIAKKVTRELLKAGKIDADHQLAFIDIVETACLLHDIGNPPFGHFGEYSIKKWSQQTVSKLFKIQKFSKQDKLLWNNKLFYDFSEFDGNAQGFRIITLLQWSFSEHGLNLTLSQLASSIKYIFAPYERTKKGYKKPGYFYSEEKLKGKIWSELKLKAHQKFPLNFIVEAADDIAYCLSDIDDAIEKKLITDEKIKSELSKLVPKENHALLNKLFIDDKYIWFKIYFNNSLMQFAADQYIAKHEDILGGKQTKSLFDGNTELCVILQALKKFSREFIYIKREAENIELTGYSVISGILAFFEPLLLVKLRTNETLEEKLKAKEFDLERRLFNRLPKTHKKAYHYKVNSIKYGKNKRVFEFYYRVHLVVDFVAGMTDSFALQIHQLFKGINIESDI